MLVASDNGTIQLISLLLHHDVNVKARDAKNSTPFHIVASSPGPGDVVDVLLDNGGGPDARDDMGWTPLHSAAQQGAVTVDVAKRLLARGANVNGEDKDRKTVTPLHLASMDKKMAHLLIREGADVHARDNDSMPFQVRPAGPGAHGRRSSHSRTRPGDSLATATRGLSFSSGPGASTIIEDNAKTRSKRGLRVYS